MEEKLEYFSCMDTNYLLETKWMEIYDKYLKVADQKDVSSDQVNCGNVESPSDHFIEDQLREHMEMHVQSSLFSVLMFLLHHPGPENKISGTKGKSLSH